MQRATSTFFSFFFFFYFLLLLFPPTTNLIDGISTLSIGAGRSFDHGKKMEKIDFIFFDCLRNSLLFSRWKKRLEETRRFVRLNFERCENEILRGTIGNNEAYVRFRDGQPRCFPYFLSNNGPIYLAMTPPIGVDHGPIKVIIFN